MGRGSGVMHCMDVSRRYKANMLVHAPILDMLRQNTVWFSWGCVVVDGGQGEESNGAWWISIPCRYRVDDNEWGQRSNQATRLLGSAAEKCHTLAD